MAPKATRRTPQKAAGRGRKVGGRRASAKQAALPSRSLARLATLLFRRIIFPRVGRIVFEEVPVENTVICKYDRGVFEFCEYDEETHKFVSAKHIDSGISANLTSDINVGKKGSILNNWCEMVATIVSKGKTRGTVLESFDVSQGDANEPDYATLTQYLPLNDSCIQERQGETR